MKFLPSRWASSIPHRFVLAVAILWCGIGSNAWADPPGRVGRVGDMKGQVWVYTPDAGEWITAVRNRPLTTGDRLATDADARVDLRIGSTTVRLDGGTELEVLLLDDSHVSLQLHNGSVATRVRSSEAARELELKTAEGRFVANRAGRYRFDRADGTSDVTVWSGEAVYEGPGSALTVYTGQRAEFWLDRDNAAQYSITDPVRDDFAAWSSERDRLGDRSASARYVSPEMTGVEDLDRYGRWEQTTEYGAVWVPTVVAAGWAPYSAGHWAWVSPWGWTWVDDAPWGFAPFHYGRWAMFHNRWCWVPGRYVRRPVYAPALVGWVGGPHFSVSISVGGGPAPAVGWFPLAPHEVYVPSYRVSPRYVQQVNVTHVTHVTNVTTIINNPQQVVTKIDYQNRRYPHAVTVVPQTVMVNRQPVAPVAGRSGAARVAQRIATQPVQSVVTAAPPVAAPAITPAIAQARRMQIHAEPARPGVVARTVAPTAAPLGVPPAPPQRPAVRAGDVDVRAMQEQQPGAPMRRVEPSPRKPERAQPGADRVPAPPGRGHTAVSASPATIAAPATPVQPMRTTPPARVVAPVTTPPAAAAVRAVPLPPSLSPGEGRARPHPVSPPPAARIEAARPQQAVPQAAPQAMPASPQQRAPREAEWQKQEPGQERRGHEPRGENRHGTGPVQRSQ